MCSTVVGQISLTECTRYFRQCNYGEWDAPQEVAIGTYCYRGVQVNAATCNQRGGNDCSFTGIRCVDGDENVITTQCTNYYQECENGKTTNIIGTQGTFPDSPFLTPRRLQLLQQPGHPVFGLSLQRLLLHRSRLRHQRGPNRHGRLHRLLRHLPGRRSFLPLPRGTRRAMLQRQRRPGLRLGAPHGGRHVLVRRNSVHFADGNLHGGRVRGAVSPLCGRGFIAGDEGGPGLHLQHGRDPELRELLVSGADPSVQLRGNPVRDGVRVHCGGRRGDGLLPGVSGRLFDDPAASSAELQVQRQGLCAGYDLRCDSPQHEVRFLRSALRERRWIAQ